MIFSILKDYLCKIITKKLETKYLKYSLNSIFTINESENSFDDTFPNSRNMSEDWSFDLCFLTSWKFLVLDFLILSLKFSTYLSFFQVGTTLSNIYRFSISPSL